MAMNAGIFATQRERRLCACRRPPYIEACGVAARLAGLSRSRFVRRNRSRTGAGVALYERRREWIVTLQQIGFDFDRLIGSRFDLCFESLVARKGDLDLMRPWRYQQTSVHALELFYVPDVKVIHENRGPRWIDGHFDGR